MDKNFSIVIINFIVSMYLSFPLHTEGTDCDLVCYDIHL